MAATATLLTLRALWGPRSFKEDLPCRIASRFECGETSGEITTLEARHYEDANGNVHTQLQPVVHNFFLFWGEGSPLFQPTNKGCSCFPWPLGI